MKFQVRGRIKAVEKIASGRGIREVRRLRKAYGGRTWRKMKGEATVQFDDGTQARVEVHWHEAHGIGKRELKIKRFLRE